MNKASSSTGVTVCFEAHRDFSNALARFRLGTDCREACIGAPNMHAQLEINSTDKIIDCCHDEHLLSWWEQYIQKVPEDLKYPLKCQSGGKRLKTTSNIHDMYCVVLQ